MCGIAGIITPSAAGNTLQHMLLQQHHRGPDHTGHWHDEACWLGHNRLAIIDTHARSNQPMVSHCGRYVMVYNGEVYNYPELAATYLSDMVMQTTSDSEIVLELFVRQGVACLQHLCGMFAIAIWDRQERTLWLIRDRFGVKPCYYAQTQNGWAFASEIKTLWAAGISRQPNLQVWSSWLQYSTYGPPHQCFWQQIQAVPAGHYAVFTQMHEPQINCWYSLAKDVAAQEALPEAQRLEAYPVLLQEAVRWRFRSDVPVGLTLSGGLDSSILLASILRQHLPGQLKAYHFYCNDAQYDELPWVQTLLKNTGIPIQPVLLEAAMVPQLAATYSTLQDEPYGGLPTIAYGQVMQQARHDGTLVLLDGQGLDEAWAGYDYYQQPSAQVVQGAASPTSYSPAFTPSFAALAQPPQYPAPLTDRLRNTQYRDVQFTKLPRALRFNDRVSMAHSVELREPFLDHRLVALGISMPPHLKIANGQGKWQLREWASQWLPHGLHLAPKRPLQTPQREWLRGPLRPWAADMLQWLAGPGNPGWFTPQGIEAGWQHFLDGKTDNSFYVWQWINAAMLLQKHA